jgi:ketosteroid isomerase-like protein
MKKTLLTLVFIALAISVYAQKNSKIEKEKEAITKLLYAEGERFIAHDMEGLTNLHITDATALRFNGNVYQGWEEIETLLKSYIERNSQRGDMSFRNEKENIIIKVTGKQAWVICDNIWKWEEEGKENSSTNTHIAFLEKIGGNWKFAFNAFVRVLEWPDPEVVKESVSSLMDDYYSAWNKGDLEILVSTLDDEGIYCGTDPSELWNKQELIDMFKQNLSGNPAAQDFSPDNREIHVAENGLSAMVVEQLSMPWSPNLPVRGTYHVVKSGNQWKLDYIGWSFLANNEDIGKLNKTLD